MMQVPESRAPGPVAWLVCATCFSGSEEGIDPKTGLKNWTQKLHQKTGAENWTRKDLFFVLNSAPSIISAQRFVIHEH